MTWSIYPNHYLQLSSSVKNRGVIVTLGNQISLTIPLTQVNNQSIYMVFTLRVLHFIKTRRRACLLTRPNFHPWTVRPVTPMPMTKITQNKSTGGIQHEYRILPSILLNRSAFKRKQLFTLGAYGGPSRTSNPGKAENSSGPFPKCTYNAFGFLWRYLKQASQINEDFGRIFYLFITKQANLACLPKLLILPGELNMFSRRETLPLTRPINI